MDLLINIKHFKKTQNKPERFKIEFLNKEKVDYSIILEEWQVRDLIGKLDNAI